MKKIVFIFFVSLIAIDAYGLFTYDRVAHLMQKGEFDAAKPLLQKMVVDSPDNPEILYDAGVASYKTKDFKQAAAYFKQATQMPGATSALKEKAYFNSANAAVELKQLDSAITDYEHVLEINPDNERAQHNLKKIKEMQEQQKQEQENNNDKKDDQKKEDKDKQEKSDKDDQSSDKQQNGDKSKQDQDREQNSENKKNDPAKDGDKKDEKQSQEQSQKDDSQDAQEKSNEKQNGQKEQQPEHDTSNKEEDKSLDKNKAEEEKKKEEAAAQKGQENKNGKEQAMQEQQAMEQKVAPHLVKVLEEQEKKDAALNKMMVKFAVNNSMAGHNGQNNW